MQGLPSPTPSSSADDRNGGQPNLKRQRSASMHSTTSTSPPKRAPSLGPATEALGPSPVPAAPEDAAADVEMLAPPSDGVEKDMLSPAPSPAPPGTRTPMWRDVSVSQKILTEESFIKAPMEPGQTWYLVSMKWYNRWRKAMTGTIDKEGPVDEQDLGPVDNSDLLEANGELIEPILEDVDAKYVPSNLWGMLVAW
jgi:ubiquitin carboxyl-terminal hydrolase 4/11